MIARNIPNTFVAIQSWSTPPPELPDFLTQNLLGPPIRPGQGNFGRLVGNTSLLSFCNAKGSMRERIQSARQSQEGVPGLVRYILRLCQQGHYFFEYMRGDSYTHISVGVRIIEIPVEIWAKAGSPWFTNCRIFIDGCTE